MESTITSTTDIFSDPNVLISLITSIQAIVLAIIGYFAGKNNQNAKKSLRQEQLINLYEPLDYLLSFSYQKSAYDLLHEIKNLISKNYRLLTPDIQKEINQLCIKENLSISDMDNLKSMVSSTYNWLRKKLSYPYNKASILRSTVSIHTKFTHVNEIILRPSVTLCVIPLLAASLTYLDGSEILSPSAKEVWTTTLGAIYAIFSILLTIFLFAEDIMDGLELLLPRLAKSISKVFRRTRGKDKE